MAALPELPPRQREILDALHRLGSGTVAEVRAAMATPPGYSAVRAMLRILEEKGHALHVEDGPRYVYGAVQSPTEVRTAALRHLLNTYFDGSVAEAVAALGRLDVP